MVKMSTKLLEMTRAKDWNYLVVSPASEDDNAIRRVNPFRVNRFFKNLCKGNTLREVRSINSGKSLLVIVESQEVAQLLLGQKKIPGDDGNDVPIKIAVSDRIGTKQGVFFCDQIVSMKDEEIVKEINLDNPDVKVVAVRRLRKKDRNGAWTESGSFVVTMRCETIPEKLKIGYLMKNMRPFIPDPMRCYRCNKLGHMSMRCREKSEDEKNCINCNEPQHAEVGVKCTKPPKCANCLSTEHNSAFRNCPRYVEDKKINEVMATLGHNRRDATILVKSSLSQPNGNAQQYSARLTLSDRIKNAQATPQENNASPMIQSPAPSVSSVEDLISKIATENRHSRSSVKESLMQRRQKSEVASKALSVTPSIPMDSDEERQIKSAAKKSKKDQTKDKKSQPPSDGSNGPSGSGKGGTKKKTNGSK